MACRVPGARNIDEFWKNLINEKETISFFTDDELRKSGIDDNLIKDPNYVKARGILGDAEYFDSSFFGFSPREAEITDPQQRIFLECAWEALEDASCCNLKNNNIRVGVFGGAGTPWNLIKVTNDERLFETYDSVSVFTNNENDYIATKVSYKLGLTGPSINLQSACSTSLAAVVIGCNSLLNDQCDIVLAGGVSIRTPEKVGYKYIPGSLDSSDGHCKTFSIDANGTVFSNGVGLVVLKRLSDAIRDKNYIYGVIKGMAINNDGNKKVGFAAPSVHGQYSVELKSIENSGINPETISYVEAHGTGTKLGDPIEIESLTRAFGFYTNKKNFCPIGSVKTNIGHTDAASGVVGLIKALLCIKHQKIPATLHFSEANPEIDFKNSPFYVQNSLSDIKRYKNFPLRVMINSLGVGGTNVNLIVEEHKKKSENTTAKIDDNLFILSAKTPGALSSMQKNLAKYITENPAINLNNVAYTLQNGRSPFEFRTFTVANNTTDLIQQLNRDPVNYVHCKENLTKIVFVFPGQGNQYEKMGIDLYKTNKIFKNEADTCFKFIEKKYGINISEKMYCKNLKGNINDNTIVSQLAMFITEYSLAKTFINCGIVPEAMIGHSIGEYTAACIGGIFTVETAISLLIKRAELLDSVLGKGKGGMIAVAISEQEALKLSNKNLEISVINDKNSIVFSGNSFEISKFADNLNKLKIPHKILSTQYAFHSSHMDEIVPKLLEYYSGFSFYSPNINIFSSVRENGIKKRLDSPEYWASHMRNTVDFHEALNNILSSYNNLGFIEIGPGASLSSIIKKTCSHFSISTLNYEKNFNNTDLMNVIGSVWANCGGVSWQQFGSNFEKQFLSLPTYPFDREKFALNLHKVGRNNVGNFDKKHSVLKTLSWKSEPLPTFKNGNDYAIWVVFYAENDISNFVLKRMKYHNIQHVIVKNGGSYSSTDDIFVIDYDNKEHYLNVFKKLKETYNGKLNILHFGNTNSNDTINYKNIKNISEKIFDELIFVQQALIESGLDDGSKINIFTTGMVDITGNGNISPEKSIVLGPCKVFVKEHKNIKCQVLDLSQNISNSDRLADSLIYESSLHKNEEIQHFNENYKWTQSFVPVMNEHVDNHKALKKEGVYIITGGLGGIGSTLAEYLFSTISAKLVLNYNSPLPDRSYWDKILRGDISESISTKNKIKAIINLEKQGAEICLFCGNVCDINAMNKMITLTKKRFGKINGIFHSAGMAGGGVISLKNVNESHEVMAPKTIGTVVLSEALKNENIDTFVLFSSVSSVIGETGQADYCSANCFLNSFAEYLKNSNKKMNSVSVIWGRWTDVGMAVKFYEEQISSSSKPKNIFYIDAKNDWIVNEHKLLGIPTLVGTSYINFLAEIFYKKNKHLVLKNLVFMAPLFLEKNDTTSLKLYSDNNNNIHFEQTINEESQKLIQASIKYVSQNSETLNVDYLKTKMNKLDKKDIGWNNIVIKDDVKFLEFGERWNVLKEVYSGDNEWLAVLDLPTIYSDDMQKFPLHPALFDVATAFCVRYVSKDTYLPFLYQEIEIFSNLLPKEIYSYVKMKKNDNEEFLDFDILITDSNGSVLIKISNYKLKKVISEINLPVFHGNDRKKEAFKEEIYDIKPQEGMKFLMDAMSTKLTNVLVYPGDIDQLSKETFTETTLEEKPLLYKRKDLATEYLAPTNEIEEALTEMWQAVFGIEKIGTNDDFLSLGGNSLIAIQIVTVINDYFKFDYTVNEFYRDKTVKCTAKHLISRLTDKASKYGMSLEDK